VLSSLRCDGFPFNTGLRHPQYVGVALTLLGGATALLGAEAALTDGVVSALLACVCGGGGRQRETPRRPAHRGCRPPRAGEGERVVPRRVAADARRRPRRVARWQRACRRVRAGGEPPVFARGDARATTTDPIDEHSSRRRRARRRRLWRAAAPLLPWLCAVCGARRWASLYVVMSAMEQAGDADVDDATPTKKKNGRVMSPAASERSTAATPRAERAARRAAAAAEATPTPRRSPRNKAD